MFAIKEKLKFKKLPLNGETYSVAGVTEQRLRILVADVARIVVAHLVYDVATLQHVVRGCAERHLQNDVILQFLTFRN